MKKFRKTFKLLGINFVLIILCLKIYGEPSQPLLFNCFSCDLPAPTNLTSTGVGSTWFSMSWDSVHSAAGYEIRVISVEADSLVSVLYTPANQTELTVFDLSPGHTYRTTVAARCLHGGVFETSTNVSLGIDHILLIVELLVPSNTPELLSPPLSQTICDNNNGGNTFHCSFDPNISNTVFGEIYSGEKFTRFAFKYVPFQSATLNNIFSVNYYNHAFTSDHYYKDETGQNSGYIEFYVKCIIDNTDVFRITIDDNNPQNIILNIKKVNNNGSVYGFRLKRNIVDKNDLIGSKQSYSDNLRLNQYTDSFIVFPNPIKQEKSIEVVRTFDTEGTVYLMDINSHLITMVREESSGDRLITC